MAIRKYYLDKRVLKTPTIGGELANLQNVLDLKDYIQEVVDSSDIEFTSINVDTINEATTGHGVIVDGVILKDTTVDVNGTADAIILDADGDTTISSPTDDQIDIEINGADDFTFTANTFTALSGSSIATNTIVETTANSGVTIDSVLLKDGSIYNTGGTMVVGFIPVGGPQELSGPGAVNITRYNTRFTSTATGNALTLADATQVGQLKKIQYVAEAAGGDTGVLTPTTPSGFATITFNAIGDYILLTWSPVGWAILEYSGVTVA